MRINKSLLKLAGLSGLCLLATSVSIASPIFTPGIDPYGSGIYSDSDKKVNIEARNLVKTADWELGIGKTNTGGLTTVDFNWVNGSIFNFSISQSAGVSTFSLGGKTLSRTDLDAVNDLFLEAKTNKNGGDVNIANIVVDGVAWSGELNATKKGNNLDILRIDGLSSGEWSLTGELTFSWNGNAPTKSNTEMIMKGFFENPPSVPEPSTFLLGALGLGLIGFFRFRK